jgi:hypothetical protein
VLVEHDCADDDAKCGSNPLEGRRMQSASNHVRRIQAGLHLWLLIRLQSIACAFTTLCLGLWTCHDLCGP